MCFYNRLAPVALLSVLALLGCGGGSNGSPSAPTSFTLSAPSLTLPVPSSVQGSYPQPYSGTVTVTLSRSAGFSDSVTLSPLTGLPANVKAAFSSTTLAAGATTAVLSVQAGYPDPSDTTFTRQLYPALGAYSIPITATSGSASVTTSLTLNLIQEAGAFSLGFTDSTGSYLVDNTNLNLLPTQSIQQYLMAYVSAGSLTDSSVSLGVQNAPAKLTVSFDATSVSLNEIHRVTFTPQTGLQAGAYAFEITATYQGLTRVLPVVITYSPAPFILQPLAPVTVAQGQSLTFPAYLWHDDTYFTFSGTLDADGDPNYLGQTLLSVSGVTASGLQVAFTNTNPTGLAAAPLSIIAGAATPAGTYPVTLQATRQGTTATAAPGVTLDVTVTAAGSSPTTWIQAVEWGQTVLAPNLRLVGGKPALLRVQLLADRSGVTAPVLTAMVKDKNGALVDTLTLQGPATVPVTVVEGDLPTASAPSGSSYTALLPKTDIQTGMTVTLSGAGIATQTLTPAVDAGYLLNLTVVPVYSQGKAPALPADDTMVQELTAFWPIQSVNLAHRPPYTTSTVIPQPSSSTSADGWEQVLGELGTLRIVDGSTANYYGFVNPGINTNFTTSIAGISLIGDGVGVGVDTVTSALFQNSNPTLDLATTVMVHEEGHAFNLNHAPAGGAGGPQLDYPYEKAAIGTWGFDPATWKAHDPAQEFDIMSYAPSLYWVSDWDYLSALGFMDGLESPSTGMVVRASRVPSEQWVVSGWIGPDGQAHLAPLVRIACAEVPPKAGDLNLIMKTAATTRAIAFSAAQVPDLPAGHRHFSFTVPAGEELTGAEVRVPGGAPVRRAPAQALAARRQALDAAGQEGALVVNEDSRMLHLTWDAQTHPYVNVIHEGDVRTVLGLHLTGGSADLPLDGLPKGGQFVIHYSDGLNPVVRRIPR